MKINGLLQLNTGTSTGNIPGDIPKGPITAVAAAASVPSSPTSMTALCTTFDIKIPSASVIPLKFAAWALNASGAPIAAKSFES